MYEKLGDCVIWGTYAIEAYRKALECWRETGAVDPLIGARLLRKQLIINTRGCAGSPLAEEEFTRSQAEAQQLAEVAGNEDELWRVRMVDLFRPLTSAAFSLEEVNERRPIGLAAAAYFEQHHDWVAFSEALDGYAALYANRCFR